MERLQDKQKTAFETLKGRFGYQNPMQVPHLEKVVLSAAVGSAKDKKRRAFIAERLTHIAGQKVAPRGARKSIASFKVRQGETIGYQATLRGARMFDFLEKLIHVALPRTRDFRGLSLTSFDPMGNYTFGVKEHTIFPETADEDIKDVFGFAVTVVTTAKTKEEAQALLLHLGFPLKREE